MVPVESGVTRVRCLDRAPARRRAAQERGSATVLLVLSLFVLSVSLAVISVTARTVLARARAQLAADAAALAGLEEGEAGAGRLAVANGAALVRVTTADAEVIVEVRRDRVPARARATRPVITP
jgi:hypothetical protein